MGQGRPVYLRGQSTGGRTGQGEERVHQQASGDLYYQSGAGWRKGSHPGAGMGKDPGEAARGNGQLARTGAAVTKVAHSREQAVHLFRAGVTGTASADQALGEAESLNHAGSIEVTAG